MGRRCALRIASVHAVIPVQEDPEVAILNHKDVHTEVNHGCTACTQEGIQFV